MGAQAAIFREGHKDASIENVRFETLRDHDVLVRVVASGICHTDLLCRSGRIPVNYPLILGHEGSGVVERVGAGVRKVAPGDHVVMSYSFCGECASCSAGKPCYCHSFYAANVTGRRLDGSSAVRFGEEIIGGHFFGQSSFATHSVASERNVVPVRKDAPIELLGPLGCGVQTGAGTVLNVLRPARGDSIAIFGAGGVGLSAVMAAAVAGCAPIIVIEPQVIRRSLALELGAHEAIDPSAEHELAARIAHLSGGGVLHAVDTSGNPAVLSQAMNALAPRGQIAILALNSPESALTVPIQLMLSRGITIRGVCEGESNADEFVPRLVDLIMDGRFPLQKLVRFYDFSEIEVAMEDQEAARCIKPIVRMPAAPLPPGG